MLDYRRLGKQRVEAMQILTMVSGETVDSGWREHAAVRMWTGYPGFLCAYGAAICTEWIDRGYKDAQLPKFALRSLRFPLVVPPWFGDHDFHESHMSNLVRKLPSHYERLFPGVPDDIPYVWPVP